MYHDTAAAPRKAADYGDWIARHVHPAVTPGCELHRRANENGGRWWT